MSTETIRGSFYHRTRGARKIMLSVACCPVKSLLPAVRCVRLAELVNETMKSSCGRSVKPALPSRAWLVAILLSWHLIRGSCGADWKPIQPTSASSLLIEDAPGVTATTHYKCSGYLLYLTLVPKVTREISDAVLGIQLRKCS